MHITTDTQLCAYKRQPFITTTKSVNNSRDLRKGGAPDEMVGNVHQAFGISFVCVCTTICLVLLVTGGGFGLGKRCGHNVYTDMIAII